MSALFERLARSTTMPSRYAPTTRLAPDCVKVNLEAKLNEESEPELSPTTTDIGSLVCSVPMVNFYEIEEELAEMVWEHRDAVDNRSRCTQPLATTHHKVSNHRLKADQIKFPFTHGNDRVIEGSLLDMFF